MGNQTVISKDKLGKYPILFDSHGNHLSYNDGRFSIEMANFYFKDELQIKDYGRGRSSAVFTAYLISNPAIKFNIFMSDIIEVIRKRVLNSGKVYGVWKFVKKGDNYGVSMVFDTPECEPFDYFEQNTEWRRVFGVDQKCSQCGELKSVGSDWNWKYDVDLLRWFHNCTIDDRRMGVKYAAHPVETD